ncbi:MAG: ATP synthase F1 subunit epsilon [Candidatus Pacebacteria bacterium]|nr:ATP synthase F1 subunit epsilon [Candidatus Paceibacterota bacterium]
MSKKLQLKIVTPEKLILEELVDQVTIPTTEGEITILPDHVPLIATIASGDIVAMSDGEHIPMEVVGGFVETKKPARNALAGGEKDVTTVTILADFAEHVSSISDVEIEKAKAKAEQLRKQAENNEIIDFEHFETELERSLNRIKIADKWRTKKYRK